MKLRTSLSLKWDLWVVNYYYYYLVPDVHVLLHQHTLVALGQCGARDVF